MTPLGVARLTSGGYKSRDPLMTLVPRGEHGLDFASSKVHALKFARTAHQILYESKRQPLFVGDGDRIKSYRLGADGSVLPVHTFGAVGRDPALALSEDGSILFEFVCRNKRTARAWRLDDQPTHGEDGKQIVGRRIEDHRMCSASSNALDRADALADRDVHSDSQIERSQGSPHDFVVKVRECGSISMCSGVVRSNQIVAASRLAVFSADLRRQTVVTRFLGHGADLNAVDPVGSRPDAFMTSCEDGTVRLYDARSPLPTISLAGYRESVVGCHVDAGGQQCSW